MPVSSDYCSSALFVLIRLPGPADNCWSVADIDLNSRRNPLRNFKYESYSKPEATHFRLRIIWLLSIVNQPLQSGSRSNGRWTATYLGTIDHWILVTGPSGELLIWNRWCLRRFECWEHHSNSVHYSQCHQFQRTRILNLVVKMIFVRIPDFAISVA
jgi:hypothetical protein